MVARLLTVCGICMVCLGQGLPDRDELVEKFVDPATTNEAARSLIENFQMGGVRTIIRNLNGLPLKERLEYGTILRNLDMMRFRNDIHENLQNAPDGPSQALYLQLLASVGEGLEPAVFEPYITTEGLDIRVRLAAASGVIQIQSPRNYDRFHELANGVVVDPELGRDDLMFAEISSKNLGFFLYTKSKLDAKKVSHGVIVAALAMAEDAHGEIYELVLELKQRKYIPQMIDRAIKVGGVSLLKLMVDHKTAKKNRDEIQKAIPVAEAVRALRARFTDRQPEDQNPIAPLLPLKGQGSGVDGLPSGYALVKVGVDGAIEILSYLSPFGGSDDLKNVLTGTTLPGFSNWKPVESFALVAAP